MWKQILGFFPSKKIVVCRTCLIIQQAFVVRVWAHCSLRGITIWKNTTSESCEKHLKVMLLAWDFTNESRPTKSLTKRFCFQSLSAENISQKVYIWLFQSVFSPQKKNRVRMLQLLRNIKKVGNTDAIIKDLYSWPAKRNAMKFLFFISYISALSTNSTFPFYFSRILKIKDAKVHNSVFLWFRSPRGSMKRVWWSFGLRTIHHLLFLSLKK